MRMLDHPCPICKEPLDGFYSQSRQIVVVECANPACVLNQRRIEGHGDHMQEAVDHIVGLALKHE